MHLPCALRVQSGEWGVPPTRESGESLPLESLANFPPAGGCAAGWGMPASWKTWPRWPESCLCLACSRCGAAACKAHALLAATRQHAHTSGCPAALTSGCPAAQMPEPAAALANWTRALGPGGVLAVCFWPPTVEEEGPWKRLFELTVGFKPQADWEAEIPAAALREGAKLLQVLRLPGELASDALHGANTTLVIVS